MIPGEAVSPAQTRILRALWAVYGRDGRATVRSVAEAAQRSVGPTYEALSALQDLGLVAGLRAGQTGAIRPTFAVEVVSARRTRRVA